MLHGKCAEELVGRTAGFEGGLLTYRPATKWPCSLSFAQFFKFNKGVLLKLLILNVVVLKKLISCAGNAFMPVCAKLL